MFAVRAEAKKRGTGSEGDGQPRLGGRLTFRMLDA